MLNNLNTFQPESATHEASEPIEKLVDPTETKPDGDGALISSLPSIQALLKPQNYSRSVAGTRTQTSIKAEKPSRFDWWTVRPDDWFIPEAALVEVALG